MHSIWIDLHDFCVVWMTALIWLVQVLIYPNFRLIADSDFTVFHKRHCDRIAVLVAPMLIQPFANFMVLLHGSRNFEWVLHSVSIALIFGATAFFSVPEHNRLGKEKSGDAITRLVNRNWIRTLLWSFELILILVRRFDVVWKSGG
jgi:hypothetical protein